MSLSLSLSNALSGLQATQATIATISNNIANVNTAGYTTKVQPQTSLTYNGVGSGVLSQTVYRQVDQFLNADIVKENSVLGQAKALNDYLSQLQNVIGTPEQGSTIGNYYNTFTNSLTALAASPEDANLQTAAVRSAQNLANQLNVASTSIQQIRLNGVNDINQTVKTINLDLTKMDTLNSQITRAKALGQSTGDLEDQRDVALNDLASNIDITTFTRSTGDVAVYTRSGDVLVDSGARQLTYTPPTTMSSTQTAGAIYLAGRDITKGGLRGGYLAGLVDMVNNQLPSVTAQLNTFAESLYSQTVDSSGRLKTNSASAPSSGDKVYQADVLGTGFTAGQTITQTLAGPPPTTATGTIVSSVPSQLPGYSTIVFTMNASTTLNTGTNAGTLYGGPISINTVNAGTGATISSTSSQIIGLAAADTTVLGTVSTTVTGGVGVSASVQGSITNGSVASIDLQSSTPITLTNPATGIPKWNGLTVTSVYSDPNNSGHQIIGVSNSSGATVSFNFNGTAATGETILRVSGQNPVLNSGQFFTNVSLSPNGVPADAAQTISVNSALDASAGGTATKLNLQNDPNALNNANYTSIAQTLSTQLSTNNKISLYSAGTGSLSVAAAKYDVGSYWTAVVATNASQASAATNYYQFQNQYTTTLTNQAASVSGVNLDQELANLTLYQNAYAASGKVVSTTAKLLDVLLSLVQ